MTWYPDLSPCDYFRLSEPERILAVGWLTRHKTFSRGPVRHDVLAKIELLAEHPLRIFVFRGFHVCELCDPAPEVELVDGDGNRVPSSSHLNIFVPNAGKVFVAPQCLPHYITAHGYCPPPDFCQAVLQCPDPRGTALPAALSDAGGPDFVAEFNVVERIRTELLGGR